MTQRLAGLKLSCYRLHEAPVSGLQVVVVADGPPIGVGRVSMAASRRKQPSERKPARKVPPAQVFAPG